MVLSFATLLLVLVGVIGAGSMVAVFAYVLNRFRMLESGGGGGGDARLLVEQVGRLAEELLTVQEEMSSLNERLDFTENLLMSGERVDESEDSE